MTEPIAVEDLDPIVTPAAGLEFPAMLDGFAYRVSLTQIYSVSKQLGLAAGDYAAENLGFDNTTSGLTAETVQDALDEIVATVLKKDASNLTTENIPAFLAAIGLDFLVGAPIPYAGSVLPALCVWPYGQNLSRTTYAGLFAKFNTTYGVGDGATTFGMPDLRGRVIAGKDDMGGAAASRLTTGGAGIDGATLGAVGGEQTHTLILPETPSHQHSLPSQYPRSTIRQNGAGGDFEAAIYDQGTSTGGQGGDGAHNNVQPTLVCNYVIFAGV